LQPDEDRPSAPPPQGAPAGDGPGTPGPDAAKSGDAKPGETKPGRRFGFIEIDAAVDSAIYRLGEILLDAFARYELFTRRFRVSGWKKGLVDVLDDAVTFGAVGAVLMLALAQPAMIEAKKDWRAKGDFAVTFLDRYGNEIGRRGILQIDTVPLEEFPDHLIKAVLATEDRRFFEHFGIDVIGTTRAIVENMRHKGNIQGGSSLTQQLAKNLFLSNERTLDRKIKEAFLAFWLETHYSKKEILKLYLDHAYMGGGTFGVAAASEFYFGKSVKDINLAEAAMLAGLFKAPTKYAPHANLANARLRANEVLTNLVQAGFMTEGQVLSARRNPAKPVERKEADTPDYFLDFAFDQVAKLDLPTKNLIVRSTVDMGLQRKAEEAVEAKLDEVGTSLHISQAAAVVMEPDGAVRAMVGGRDYGVSQFNRATDAMRQPGSSFKPYVYLAALTLGGKTPTSMVTDTPYCIGDWCPGNFGGSYYGRVTLTEAIARSLNSVPVQLTAAMGKDKVAAFARSFGLPIPEKPEWPFVIGASEVRVIDQAVGFATFASGGLKPTAWGIEDIRDGEGKLLWSRTRNAPPPVRVAPRDKVEQLNAMLNNAVERGTGSRARLDGVPAGGKTGTTNSSRDAWFCGFTGNYVGVVWVGNDDYRQMEKVTGGVVPAPIWNSIMTYAHQSIDLKQAPGFPAPTRAPLVADAGKGATAAAPQKPGLVPVAGAGGDRPWQLTARSAGVLTDIGTALRALKPVEAKPAARLETPRQQGMLTPVSGGGRLALVAGAPTERR
jgi:penicillin-binding protein 1A